MRELRDPDPGRRMEAVSHAAIAGDWRLVCAALDDENSSVREAAMDAAEDLDERAVAEVQRSLRKKRVPAAATVLGRLGHEESIPLLRVALRHKRSSADLEREAALALGSFGSPEAIDALIEELGDTSRGHDHAIDALVVAGEAAVPSLSSQVTGPDPQRAKWALVTLGEIDTPGSGPALVAGTLAEEPEVATAALQALGEMTTREEALLTALRSPSEPIRIGTVALLARFPQQEAALILVLQTDQSEQVRLWTVAALAQLGTREAMEAVEQASLQDASPTVQAAARRAISPDSTREPLP